MIQWTFLIWIDRYNLVNLFVLEYDGNNFWHTGIEHGYNLAGDNVDPFVDIGNTWKSSYRCPRCSMYGIFTYILFQKTPKCRVNIPYMEHLGVG